MLALHFVHCVATELRALFYFLVTGRESTKQQALWLRTAGFPRPELVFSMETYLRETANDPKVAADLRVQAAEQIFGLSHAVELMGPVGGICFTWASDRALEQFKESLADV